MYDDWCLRFAHWAVEQGIILLRPTAAEIETFLFSPFKTPFVSNGQVLQMLLNLFNKDPRHWRGLCAMSVVSMESV